MAVERGASTNDWPDWAWQGSGGSVAVNQRNSELVGMLSADFVRNRLPVAIVGRRVTAIMDTEIDFGGDVVTIVVGEPVGSATIQQPTLLSYRAIVSNDNSQEGYVSTGVLLPGESANIFDVGGDTVEIRLTSPDQAVEVERTGGGASYRGLLRMEWLHNISVSNITAPPPGGIFNDAEGDPSSVSTTPADGTSAFAARRDHVHDLDDDVVVTDKIADGAVTDAKLRDSAALSVIGRSADTVGVPADIVAASDAQVLRRAGTAVGFGEVATAGIEDDAVTNAKLADMAQATIKGRAASAGTGNPVDLTDTQVATIVEAVIMTLAGAQTVTGAKTFSAAVTAARFRSNLFSISDDNVQVVTPPLTTGMILINSQSGGSNRADVQTIVAFRCTTGLGAFTRIVGQPATAVQVTTGVLTGTTGADGFFTVSADATTNMLYLENRTNAGIAVSIVFLG